MALITQLLQWALTIKNQTKPEGNTETLVGGLFEAIVNYIKSLEDKIASLIIGLLWKDPVNTYSQLATTYPNPSIGWAVLVKDESIIYSWNGLKWANTGLTAFPSDVATKTDLLEYAKTTTADGIIVRTPDGKIPVVDLTPYAKTTTAEGTVVRTSDGTIPKTEGLFDASAATNNYSMTLAQAIEAVPSGSRKNGLLLKYAHLKKGSGATSQLPITASVSGQITPTTGAISSNANVLTHTVNVAGLSTVEHMAIISQTGAGGGAFFTSANVFISGYTFQLGGHGDRKTVNIPSNAAILKFSYYTDAYAASTSRPIFDNNVLGSALDKNAWTTVQFTGIDTTGWSNIENWKPYTYTPIFDASSASGNYNLTLAEALNLIPESHYQRGMMLRFSAISRNTAGKEFSDWRSASIYVWKNNVYNATGALTSNTSYDVLFAMPVVEGMYYKFRATNTLASTWFTMVSFWKSFGTQRRLVTTPTGTEFTVQALEGETSMAMYLRAPAAAIPNLNITDTIEYCYSTDTVETSGFKTYEYIGKSILKADFVNPENWIISQSGGSSGTGGLNDISSDKSLQIPRPDGLARLYIEAATLPITKGDAKPCKASLLTKSGVYFRKDATIDIQGSTSAENPTYLQKNYSITLYNSDGSECELKVGDTFPDTDAHLKCDWMDSSHNRNIGICNIIYKYNSQKEYPYRFPFEPLMTVSTYETGARALVTGFPFEMYINNGWWGLYTWNLRFNRKNFNIAKDNPVQILMKCGSSSNPWEESTIQTNDEYWDIKAPKTITTEVKATIMRLFNFLRTQDAATYKTDLKNYMNIDSVLEYFIYVDAFQMIDNFIGNLALVTYDGLIWYAQVYDADTSLGLGFLGASKTNPATPLSSEQKYSPSIWFPKIWAAFQPELKVKYADMRKKILNMKTITDEFSGFEKLIGNSIFERDLATWPTKPGNTVPTNANHIIMHFKQRLVYLDAKYEYLP